MGPPHPAAVAALAYTAATDCPMPPPPLRRRWGKLGRVLFPFPLFAYPFYLFNRSPGKDGSHFDPNSPLFTPQVRQCDGQGRAGLGSWVACAGQALLAADA